MSYTTQRQWSDRLLPQVKQILSNNANMLLEIRYGTMNEDTKQATDLRVLIAQGGTIAVRTRTPDCLYRDLTIRAKSRYNSETEIHKLRQGWGKWYFYGWTNQDDIIEEWIVVDLDLMRFSGILKEDRRLIPNGDDTGFFSYSLSEIFPFIVANVLSKNTRMKAFDKTGETA